MTEYETDPQRHESSSTDEPSHTPADASHESSNPARGQSDTTAQQPTLSRQPAAPQSGIPQSGIPQSGASQSGASQSGASQPGVSQPGGFPQSGAPQAGYPQSGAPQHQPGAWLASPWQRGAQHPGQPVPGQPVPGQPAPGQPHYGQAQYPGQQPPQYPGQPQPPYAGAYAGQPQYATAQTGAGQWTPGNGVPPQEVPAWAQNVSAEQRDPARTGRGRRIFVAGAAAILIALGAGGVGAATALAFDDNGPSTVQTGNSAVTRMVDRSSLAQIAAAVQDSVVSITTQSGEGSGVIVTAEGYIVTNNHVVATATGDTVTVIFADGKKAEAKIVGTDPKTDLAVIKATGVSGLKAAQFGDSSQMQVGDTVLALGSPLGLEGSVTAGIISAKDRTIQSSSEDEQQPQTPQNPFGGQEQQQQQAPSAGTTSMSGLLQTDAPINPGNSGGALVNVDGKIIGINSAIATSGQGSGNIGLGFAIPSNKAKQVADDLMAGRKVSHAALGVSVAEVEGGGALVKTVTPNSAAAKAGLQQNDVIVSVNGKPVNDSEDLIAIIQAAKVGDKVTVVFTRNGAQQTVNATLAEAS